MNLRVALAALALVTVACSSPSSEDTDGANQNLGGASASTNENSEGLSEGDRLASEVILRQVLDAHLVTAAGDANPDPTLLSVLEGSPDPRERASVISVDCKTTAGTKTCKISVGVELTNPGPDDDHGYHTVYGVNVDLKAGKILGARWELIAG